MTHRRRLLLLGYTTQGHVYDGLRTFQLELYYHAGALLVCCVSVCVDDEPLPSVM
jgi:hypothetical protein